MSSPSIEDLFADGGGEDGEDPYPEAQLKTNFEMEAKLGAQIGHGTARDVFSVKNNDKVVIKKDHVVPFALSL